MLINWNKYSAMPCQAALYFFPAAKLVIFAELAKLPA